MELPGRLHPPRRSLRPLPPRRLRAVGRRGRRSAPAARRGRAASTACARAGTVAARPPRARRPSSRRRWATWSRRSASCRRASRRSRRGWPRRTGRWRARPGSSPPASSAPWSGRWRPTCWRARPAASWSTPTAVRAGSCATLHGHGVRRRTASSRGARWPCVRLEHGCAVTIAEASEHLASERRRLARGRRAQRGGRPPPTPRAAAAAGAEPRAPWRAGAPLVVRLRAGRGGRRAGCGGAATSWTAGPSTRRRGSCCCTRAGFVEVAPLPGRDRDRRRVRPGGRRRPRERHPPLRPRPAPWRRRRAAHPAPARRHPGTRASARRSTSTPSDPDTAGGDACPCCRTPESARAG